MTLSDGVEFVAQGGGGEPARPPLNPLLNMPSAPIGPCHETTPPSFSIATGNV